MRSRPRYDAVPPPTASVKSHHLITHFFPVPKVSSLIFGSTTITPGHIYFAACCFTFCPPQHRFLCQFTPSHSFQLFHLPVVTLCCHVAPPGPGTFLQRVCIQTGHPLYAGLSFRHKLSKQVLSLTLMTF